MKTLILQYWIGGGGLPSYIKISRNKFKEYADRHGADYMFSTTPKLNPTNPFFEYLRILQEKEFDQYDKILYVDIDVIPEVMEENIFDIPIVDIAAVPEFTPEGRTSIAGYDFPHKQKAYRSACRKFDIPVVKPKTVKAAQLIFNSGVIVWNRSGIEKAKKNFLNWHTWYTAFDSQLALDQTYITGQIVKYLDYTELPYKWNCSPRMKFHEGFVPEEMNFIHYTGGKKNLIEGLYT